MKDIILNFKDINTRAEAHKYIARKMDLPEYYGNNLDALFDCLSEISNVSVDIRNLELGDYGEKLIKAFADRANDSEDFIVTVSYTPEKVSTDTENQHG